jgi:hypothetical protein
MNQIAAIAVKAVTEAPRPAQGEIAARSSAEPKRTKIKETEAATTAPQKIAAHETAGWDDSTGAERSAIEVCRSVSRLILGLLIYFFAALEICAPSPAFGELS